MTKSIGIENFSLCPECGSYTNFSSFRGEKTCSQCGLVINERMFNPSNRGKKKFEVIFPPRFRFFSLYQFYIHKRDGMLPNNYQKNLVTATKQLNRICRNLELPPIVKEEARRLYIQALKKGLVRGHSIIGMVCACIFHVSKTHYYRSFIQISEQINGLVGRNKNEKKHVISCYIVIVKELKLKYQSRTIASRIPRFISEAGLNGTLTPIITKYLEQCNAESLFNGKDPNGVIAASTYILGKKYGYNIIK